MAPNAMTCDRTILQQGLALTPEAFTHVLSDHPMPSQATTEQPA